MSKEGADFFKKGEKSLKKYERFGKEGKLLDAIENFQKSADSYQKANDWIHAGDSYFKAADCLQENSRLSEAAATLTNAGHMYAKSPETAQKSFESFSLAARYFREDSKPINGAKLLCDAGKLFYDQKDIENAINSYKGAAQIYDDENKSVQAANQIAIIADIYSSQNNWLEASNYYKDVAKRRFSDSLTKISAVEFCTKAVICRMAADDVVGAESYMNDFSNEFPSWERSKEYIVLRALARAIENRDVDGFSKVVADYDQYKMLDDWTSNSLQAVKQLLINGEEEEIC